MYLISVTTHFDAAHSLPGYDGLCSNLHGHRWEVKACWQMEKDGTTGMCVDFKKLKEVLNKECEKYDHANLNDDYDNPTAENLKWLAGDLINLGLELPEKIELISTEACAALMGICFEGNVRPAKDSQYGPNVWIGQNARRTETGEIDDRF